tara:strand:+ start:994 stop:1248 length:255 start_codon:yes stop_codon:yes gene_type:complete
MSKDNHSSFIHEKANVDKERKDDSKKENYSSTSMSYESEITKSLESSKRYYIEWFNSEMEKGDDYFMDFVFSGNKKAKARHTEN